MYALARKIIFAVPCWVIFVAGALILSGCSETIHPEFVAKRWSNTLSAFNIDPVFPPRYMQVGDVYLFLLPSGKSTAEFYKRRALRLGRAEVRRMLMDDMQTDLILPTTGAKNPSINIFNVPSKIVRLKPVAYPGFNIAQVTEAELGASFPIQVFRTIFGGATTNNLALSISIPQAEDSELPANDAYRALVSYCAPNRGVNLCSTAAPRMMFFVRNLCPPDEAPDTILTPWIAFVNHVYYTRQIDYAYTTSGGEAIGTSVAVTATSSGSASADPKAPKPSSSNSTAGASEPQTDAEKEIQVLQKQIDELENQLGSVGGRLQVLAANSKGTLLTQTFDTPVAIGYRALWFAAGPPDTYCYSFPNPAPPRPSSPPNGVGR